MCFCVFLWHRVYVCIVGKCRHGILAALSMKYDEPSTLEFAERRRHIDYTQHRLQAADDQWYHQIIHSVVYFTNNTSR